MLRELTIDQIKVGMNVVAAEQYSGVKITYEGLVYETGSGDSTARIGDAKNSELVWLPDEAPDGVTATWHEVIELPTTTGSMIECQISVDNLEVVRREEDRWLWLTGPDTGREVGESWIVGHMTRVLWVRA